jgi:hypothetical protein
VGQRKDIGLRGWWAGTVEVKEKLYGPKTIRDAESIFPIFQMKI